MHIGIQNLLRCSKIPLGEESYYLAYPQHIYAIQLMAIEEATKQAFQRSRQKPSESSQVPGGGVCGIAISILRALASGW